MKRGFPPPLTLSQGGEQEKSLQKQLSPFLFIAKQREWVGLVTTSATCDFDAITLVQTSKRLDEAK
ncbi:MAG: hypothetical protein WC837_06375 [Bellilinea sp.]